MALQSSMQERILIELIELSEPSMHDSINAILLIEHLQNEEV